MVANDPSAVLNAVICGVIVIVLMFYRRGDATHRPLISLLAYVMVLVYASVPFRFVFGLYESSHWLVVMVNILICAAVLWARGKRYWILFSCLSSAISILISLLNLNPCMN